MDCDSHSDEVNNVVCLTVAIVEYVALNTNAFVL